MIWLLRALLAAAVFLAFALAPPSLGLDAHVWFGDRILARGGVPLALGDETFGAPGSPSGAFGWLSAVVLALLEAAAPHWSPRPARSASAGRSPSSSASPPARAGVCRLRRVSAARG